MPYANADITAAPLSGLRARCAGLILAGGAARRLGGIDKGRLLVGGRPILARVAETLRHQTARLALSANGEATRLADLGLPVLADPVPGLGPLGGLLAGLSWAETQGLEWLLTAPTDTPFLPPDLLLRLGHGLYQAGAAAAIASSGGRRHHVVGLWAVGLRPRLRQFLLAEGQRRTGDWAAACGAAVVAWPDEPVDPFFNVNTPQEHAAAMALAPLLPRRSAAVVLPRGSTGHELLANFAAALRQEGVKLGGLLQRGSKSGGDKPEDVTLMALDDGQVFPIMQRLSRAGACTADPHGIAAASAALRRAVALRLAPVLVNKFGPLEAECEGLADEMLAVMAEGLPLLTTVAETRLDAWLRFCGGQCDLLGNDLPSLRRWWQGGQEPGQ